MKTYRRHIRPKVTHLDGYTFGSRLEARRYATLALEQKAGLISGLAVHPTLPLTVNGRKIGRGWLTLDFRYERNGAIVYEDVKGVDTRESRLRRELAEAIHGIKIEVVT